jgi:DNA-3-methyladenine glycosylase II
MILLYTLQRPNIFPYDDYHVKAIMVKRYGLNPNVKLKAQMLAVAENWGRQKSLAVLYLLESKKLPLL